MILESVKCSRLLNLVSAVVKLAILSDFTQTIGFLSLNYTDCSWCCSWVEFVVGSCPVFGNLN